MQVRTSQRRSNQDRREETRAKLMAAARDLFVERSYAETGTPEIVKAAGVTRGALYHHFADKQALFHAVVEQEAQCVAEEIEGRTENAALAPTDALIEGGDAFLQAMKTPGRTRLLLLDGPSVLGRAAMDEIEAKHGNRTLREGLEAAMKAGMIRQLPLEPLTALLAAAYDRAALAIESGSDAQAFRHTLAAILKGMAPADRVS